jgi:hypothetical protein
MHAWANMARLALWNYAAVEGEAHDSLAKVFASFFKKKRFLA